jgi:hypothetical protein
VTPVGTGSAAPDHEPPLAEPEVVPASDVTAELVRGAALAFGVALVAPLLAAARLASAGQQFVLAWAVLFGCTALVAVPAVALARAARSVPGAWPIAGAALAVAMPLWMAVAAVLKSTTHHRPLGATTFAFAAAAVLAGSIILSARLVSGARVGQRRGIFRLLTGLVVALALLLAVRLSVSLFAEPARSARPHVLDGALLLGLATVAVFVPLRVRALRGSMVATAWLVASAAAVVLLRTNAGLREAAEELAPVFTSLGGWFAG